MNHEGLQDLDGEFAAIKFFNTSESHPAIVQCYGMLAERPRLGNDVEEYKSYVVMEYNDNWVPLSDALAPQSWNDEQEKKKLVNSQLLPRILEELTPDDKHLIIMQLISAVAHMHSFGWMHRELNPDNIMYDPDTKKIKIIGFGSAKEFNTEKGKDEVRASDPVDYVSPELLENYSRSDEYGRIPNVVDDIYVVDHKPLDVWALGPIIYEVAFGQSSRAMWGLADKNLSVSAVIQGILYKPLRMPTAEQLAATRRPNLYQDLISWCSGPRRVLTMKAIVERFAAHPEYKNRVPIFVIVAFFRIIIEE